MNIKNTRLVLVGQGPYLNSLQKNVKNSSITFAGFSSNPIEWIQHFDVCLLPTLFPYESLPTVVIEYLYCGKPVIATQVGEIDQMLTTPGGGKAGFLLEFNNENISTTQLTSFMQEFYYNKKLHQEMSQNAVEAFIKFDMSDCISQYIENYSVGKN